ncbi:MAG: energy-coupled thiamine transporter ThiT [Firmicutes bacterium]|nr:energy-coupled thiamine transporter ThiT [Bacillota bacterium]
MTYIGVGVGLALVLQFVRVFRMPQGGSVSLETLPIVILAFAFGPRIGMLSGLLFGILQLMLDAYIVHPVQLLLDYPLPFAAIGLAGLWKERKALSLALAYFLRFLFHFISGVVFFGEYAPEGSNVLVYSAVYNGSYLIPEAIIVGLVGVWLWRRIESRGFISLEG